MKLVLYTLSVEKEMIISGGENIYPLEVEQVINKLSDVYEVAVVGRQHVKVGRDSNRLYCEKG